MPEIDDVVTVPIDDYDRFYGHYAPFVTSFIARRVAADDVQDLVAEVFAVTWRRRNDIPADGLPWLYRTARNVVGNRYRSKGRLAALQSKMRSVPAESSEDPIDVADDRAQLVSAFSELDESDRELLLLIAWEGLTTPEAAAVLEISPGTASVRLHRARQRLDSAIERHEMYEKGEH